MREREREKQSSGFDANLVMLLHWNELNLKICISFKRKLKGLSALVLQKISREQRTTIAHLSYLLQTTPTYIYSSFSAEYKYVNYIKDFLTDFRGYLIYAEIYNLEPF